MRRLLLLTILICGCAQKVAEGRKEAVPLDQVPAPVMKAAQERLPEVKFDSAFKTPEGLYEIRGKTKTGKIQEAEVNAAGEVVLVE